MFTRHVGPSVRIIEEGMREGLQIETVDISTADKIDLLNRLSRTGLKHIAVGSFVSPRWVPQMADVDDVIRGFEPVGGVEYLALALNEKGRERYRTHIPPLSPTIDRARTIVHLCDVFVQRNTNSTQADEIARWPTAVQAAVAANAGAARIGVNAAWGSNWLGRFSLAQRMDLLRRQHELWADAGIAVTEIFLGDPMGWEDPLAVEEQLATLLDAYPDVTTYHLHLHNTRGQALGCAYAAWRVLDSTRTLVLDACVGGMGGCPYCGNGRAAGLLATEDLVQMLESIGVDTGIDLPALVDVAKRAEELIGHVLHSHLPKAGPLPIRAADLYAMDMPLIETFEEAQHFRLGPTVYDGAPSPWKEPISSAARDAVDG